MPREREPKPPEVSIDDLAARLEQQLGKVAVDDLDKVLQVAEILKSQPYNVATLQRVLGLLEGKELKPEPPHLSDEEVEKIWESSNWFDHDSDLDLDPESEPVQESELPHEPEPTPEPKPGLDLEESRNEQETRLKQVIDIWNQWDGEGDLPDLGEGWNIKMIPRENGDITAHYLLENTLVGKNQKRFYILPKPGQWAYFFAAFFTFEGATESTNLRASVISNVSKPARFKNESRLTFNDMTLQYLDDIEKGVISIQDGEWGSEQAKNAYRESRPDLPEMQFRSEPKPKPEKAERPLSDMMTLDRTILTFEGVSSLDLSKLEGHTLIWVNDGTDGKEGEISFLLKKKDESGKQVGMPIRINIGNFKMFEKDPEVKLKLKDKLKVEKVYGSRNWTKYLYPSEVKDYVLSSLGIKEQITTDSKGVGEYPEPEIEDEE